MTGKQAYVTRDKDGDTRERECVVGVGADEVI